MHVILGNRFIHFLSSNTLYYLQFNHIYGLLQQNLRVHEHQSKFYKRWLKKFLSDFLNNSKNALQKHNSASKRNKEREINQGIEKNICPICR